MYSFSRIGSLNLTLETRITFSREVFAVESQEADPDKGLYAERTSDNIFTAPQGIKVFL
jgi:hypothetical protein